MQYMGLSGTGSQGYEHEGAAIAARYGFMNDPSMQVLSDVAKQPVWEVLFENVKLFDMDRDMNARTNENIAAIHTVIDAENGFLIRVASPKPAKGGLETYAGPTALKFTLFYGSGMYVSIGPKPPAVSFMEAVELAVRQGPRPTEAKEIEGHLVFVTDRPGWLRKRHDKPCWVISFGGVNARVLSRGPGGGWIIIMETRIVLDAETGKPYGGHRYLGRSDLN